jgi:hypothetical protein
MVEKGQQFETTEVQSARGTDRIHTDAVSVRRGGGIPRPDRSSETKQGVLICYG